jgi:hypothetical protein
MVVNEHARLLARVAERDEAAFNELYTMNRPGLVGDSWPWRIKDGVHAIRADQWEADYASVFG